MNRRLLLAYVLAAIAGPAPAKVPGPILWGDGIHDDLEGLTAFFRGEPVYRPNGERVTRL